ncbi:hypothetical protein PV10_00403 [Exophiala mesophila]|uniref:Phosphoinositide phospholipase C n=1 Tax=Exophiala mesophila TaxID=212818 RepID=A0A0D2ACA9_EXOME|nr:uncharacterized protein PV10_00403 [Exophiala mesophila]KIV96553.1 hypothetical protein PV10_00403 [Exophiala mesophila]
MADSSAAVTSRLSRLNPFSRSKPEVDDEDIGEEVDSATVAGGGHSARQSDITKNQLRVSRALRRFLIDNRMLSEDDARVDNNDQLTPRVRALLEEPHIHVPAELTDRSHPLPDYFISSSHNTYLLAHQLYGSSSASAYESTLLAGARCVEIDAWDNDENENEPKVTHGYTLVSNISFRAVCETIRDVVDKEATESTDAQGYRAAPILLSLENHCGPQGQMRLVQIMKEVWGDRLLDEAVRQKGHEEQQGLGGHVRLSDLGSKIAVIVEYHHPDEKLDSDDTESSSSDSDDENETPEEKEARKQYKQNKQNEIASKIIPELADLGVYAQSVKPSDNSWYDKDELTNTPHHPLINLSESGLGSHMPTHSDKIARNNAKHLMRVYPKGTRISSRNLKPVPFWGVGAQICALNWQTFGASMQINEALFSDTDGYVLKPGPLRAGGTGVLSSRKRRVTLHVGGATDIPVPEDREPSEVKPYITCTLVHPDDLADTPPKRKTSAYRQHKLTGFLNRHNENPPVTDPLWDEKLHWDYRDNDLTFLRILLKSDDAFARNPIFAVTAVRLTYVVPGQWRFIRLLDLKGRETKCALLVKFDFEDL